MKISRSLVKAFFIAPFNIMIAIPGLTLWFSNRMDFAVNDPWRFDLAWRIAGLAMIAAGAFLAYRCVSLFTDHGDGTPAPWDPPRNLVVCGLYRYVRNPMVEGVACVLFGETLLFNSPPLFLWFLTFVFANLLYTPLVEEPKLIARFGDSYRLYMQNVHRWLPRKTPWKGSNEENQKLPD